MRIVESASMVAGINIYIFLLIVQIYVTGDRVFHQKFGYGAVTEIEGNKLTVDFEKAGEKRVIDSFVERG